MTKCNICHADAIWAWQPFGPDDKTESFTTLGSHYRGFAVIKVCDLHKSQIEAGRLTGFSYGGTEYAYENGQICTLSELAPF